MIKYYKDSINQVYAFAADGSEDAWIPVELILITEEEAELLRQQPVIHASAVEMWGRIKAERDSRMDSGFKVGVKWYHSDTKSRIQHLGLHAFGVSVPPVPWKTMDGSFEPMTQEIAQAILQAALTLDGALFLTAEQHKAQMEAAAEPWNYDYSTGWPERYADSILQS
jgi:hypothetical protein